MADEGPNARAAGSGGERSGLWLILGDKLGDNAQAEIIAEALGWSYRRKDLRFRSRYVHGKPRFGPSLHHLDRERSDDLAPPWPDIVLTVGRRPAMAALWVREQSGRRTRIVLIGRPRRGLKQYDLVVAPPQYRVPRRANVLHLGLPLMRVDEAAIDEARARWQPDMAGLPRPLTAVLVGGPTWPFRFDAPVARDLLRETLKVAGDAGSLYVTTSRRTPRPVAEALESALPEGARLFSWSPGAPDNPYLGLLALADRFVVTGDSISMLTEVARLGKPLALYSLPVKHPIAIRLRRMCERFLLPGEDRGWRLGKALGDCIFGSGMLGCPRDLTAMHDRLISTGLGVRLGDPFPSGGRKAPDSLARVVARVEALAATERRGELGV